MEFLIVAIFLAGYALISLEHSLRVDKSAIALLTASALWLAVAAFGLLGSDLHHVLTLQLSPIAEIVFFLMGAMTIVEVIDGHGGFAFVTDKIGTRNKKKLLVVLGTMTFFLSAILDNLTTTIVMVAVMLKFVTDTRDKVLFTGIIVIAANSGGAFSPIGDVTTTMLWIGGQISPINVIERLFFPSIVSYLVPLLLALTQLKGDVQAIEVNPIEEESRTLPRKWERLLVLVFSIGALVSVPVFKILTGLPPFMGILAALGLLWLITEILQLLRKGMKQRELTVTRALGEIDMSSILFFVGILLSVAALEVSGVLHKLADWLQHSIDNLHIVSLGMGFLSSVFDNVPLVSASLQMYPLTEVPADSSFWHFTAYAAGTGGSMLIIGSAAGVTAMGSSKVTFGAYATRIGPLALLGYLAGAGIYFLQKAVFGYPT